MLTLEAYGEVQMSSWVQSSPSSSYRLRVSAAALIIGHPLSSWLGSNEGPFLPYGCAPGFVFLCSHAKGKVLPPQRRQQRCS